MATASELEFDAMKSGLVMAAVSEIATGAALVCAPSLLGQLLLGAELAGIAMPLARVLGFALIGLGIACWPGTPRDGMVAYSTSVAAYLAYLGVWTEWAGPLLWPAVLLHAVMSLLLTRPLFNRDGLTA